MIDFLGFARASDNESRRRVPVYIRGDQSDRIVRALCVAARAKDTSGSVEDAPGSCSPSEFAGRADHDEARSDSDSTKGRDQDGIVVRVVDREELPRASWLPGDDAPFRHEVGGFGIHDPQRAEQEFIESVSVGVAACDERWFESHGARIGKALEDRFQSAAGQCQDRTARVAVARPSTEPCGHREVDPRRSIEATHGESLTEEPTLATTVQRRHFASSDQGQERNAAFELSVRGVPRTRHRELDRAVTVHIVERGKPARELAPRRWKRVRREQQTTGAAKQLDSQLMSGEIMHRRDDQRAVHALVEDRRSEQHAMTRSEARALPTQDARPSIDDVELTAALPAPGEAIGDGEIVVAVAIDIACGQFDRGHLRRRRGDKDTERAGKRCEVQVAQHACCLRGTCRTQRTSAGIPRET
ncbi:MAG: hypothetical protein L6Q99_05310 [Planctomycetes bacterium]|nr:hypothetical protein [Planctomycetota bacterium]